MNLYKVFNTIILSFSIIMLLSGYVYADDLYPLEDNYDILEIFNDIDSIETNSNSLQMPTINSRAYVVIDRNSNTILLGKNENQKKKMASTTKIMTALVVLENSTLTDIVEVSKKSANTGGSRLGLKTGDKITVLDLLYGLMMCSGNDAAVALAEYISGSIPEFANLMNKKAKELNLSNTHFVTPHGLDEDEHYTTAYELALLANYAMNNEIFAKIVGTKNYTITINGYPKSLTNTNELLGVLDGVYGIKTGFTNGANRCLVSSCKRGDIDIICVVLGADTKKFRTTDSVKLIEYVYNNFVEINIEKIISEKFQTWKDEYISSVNIEKSISKYFDITFDKIPYSSIPVRSDLQDKFDVYIDCKTSLTAPILPNTPIGTLVLTLNDETIYSTNIYMITEIKRKNVFGYLLYFVQNFSNIFNSCIN